MKYSIKVEKMGGIEYWMIYKRFWIFKWFFERWNTAESVSIRIKELCKIK